MLMKWMWPWEKPKGKMWKLAFQATTHGNRLLPDSVFFNKTLLATQPFFYASILKIPHSGNKTSFWNNDWGLGILRDDYQMLFTYARNPEITLPEALGENILSNLLMHNISEPAQTQLDKLDQSITNLDL